MFVGFSLSAQIYEQNFDSYTSGDYLAVVDANWTTWTNQPGTAEDAMISDAYSTSAPNSVLVTGTTDAVYPCGDLTSGAYSISFDYYIPAGKAGYYNVQHVFASEWALEVYIHADMTSRIIAGGQEITDAVFAADTWTNVDVNIDMNNDEATMYWDGVEIITWQWSLKTDGTPGTNQLGCVNMYAGAEGTDAPEYYFDNFVFEEMPTVLYYGNFDEFSDGDFLAVVDPENWTTWTNQPGSAEDAVISNAFSETAPNSAMVTGSTDAIFSFGDLTSGSYEVSFDMYVPAGNAGYFNIEHIFASEWALECYFNADLSTQLDAGGQSITDVTYPADTWFNVLVAIDMDGDDASMYLDGVEVLNWQWSLKTDGTPGTNQLGVADMFAGANGTDNPLYYFDNFTFLSMSSGLTPPTVELDTEEFVVEIADGTAVIETFNIANIGEQDLSYDIYATYDIAETTGTATNTMAYCGEFNGGVGYANAVAAKIAVLFEPSILEEYIGTSLTSIDFYIADQALDLTVNVWGQGGTTVPGPGAVVSTQTFNPTIGAWNTATLAEPIILDGTPIWLGVTYFQPAGLYSMGCDAGPKVPGVNWSSTGPAWSELTLDYNWNIRGNVVGDPYNTFIDVPVNMGVLPGGTDENVSVFFDPTDLAAGQYTGTIVVATNDQVTNYATIAVTLDIVTAVNDINVQDALYVYPNPASEFVTVKADGIVNQVSVSNYLGQVVNTFYYNNNEVQVDLSQLENGVYFVEVTTDLAKHTVKVVKK